MYPLLRVAVCVSMPEVPSSPIPVLLSSTAVSLVRLSLLHPLQYISLSLSLVSRATDEGSADLKIGTFSKIVTRPLGTRLIDIFNLFAETGYSAIPIVDENGTRFRFFFFDPSRFIEVLLTWSRSFV
jgi:CBS domain-containing protein